MSDQSPVMSEDARMRYELLQLLNGRNAHMNLADAAADFPVEAINNSPPNAPYTFWHLIEHLRIAQEDILEFIVDPAYEAREWPAGYWPAPDAQATPQEWQQSLDAFAEVQAQLSRIVEHPAVDLLADLAHAPGYTIYREIMLVADHNAYHIGELAILRQVMRLWPEEESAVP